MSVEVPEGWKSASLGDVISLEYGKALPASTREEGDVPVYGSSGITGYHSQPLIDGPGIIVGRKGTIGSVHFSGVPFWPIDTVYFTKEKLLVDRTWLLNSLRHLRLDRLNEANAVPGLNRENAYRSPLPLPPLPEQQKIAEILNSVDDAIQATEAVIEQTKKVKQGVMNQLLTKGIGHTRFKQTEIGEIPEEWEVLTIGQLVEKSWIATIQDGNHGGDHPKQSDYVSEGVPFLMARDISDGVVNVSDCIYLPEIFLEKLRVGFAKPGDVLISHKGTIGRVAILDDSFDDYILTPQLTSYRLLGGRPLERDYLATFFEGSFFQKSIVNNSDQTTRKYISLRDQKRLLVVVPPVSDQRKIVEAAGEISRLIKDGTNELKGLERTKAALMSDLLTGRKRVVV